MERGKEEAGGAGGWEGVCAGGRFWGLSSHQENIFTFPSLSVLKRPLWDSPGDPKGGHLKEGHPKMGLRSELSNAAEFMCSFQCSFIGKKHSLPVRFMCYPRKGRNLHFFVRAADQEDW